MIGQIIGIDSTHHSLDFQNTTKRNNDSQEHVYRSSPILNFISDEEDRSSPRLAVHTLKQEQYEIFFNG